MNFQRLLFVASLFLGSLYASVAYGSSNQYLSADNSNVSGFTRYKMSDPKTDFEVKQQSDSAMQWMHDAKIGMFIHWGLYAGPARGEWNMNTKGIKPEEYRKLAYAESGDQWFCYKNNRIYVYLLGEYTSDELALPAMDKGYRVRKAYALDGGSKVTVKQKGQTVTLGGLKPNKDEVKVIVLELNKNI